MKNKVIPITEKINTSALWVERTQKETKDKLVHTKVFLSVPTRYISFPKSAKNMIGPETSVKLDFIGNKPTSDSFVAAETSYDNNETRKEVEVDLKLSKENISLLSNWVQKQMILDEISNDLNKITKKSADLSLKNLAEETASDMLALWDKIVRALSELNLTMEQLEEDTYLSISDIAADTATVLHNAGRYEESIRVNEQILALDWDSDISSNLKENARMDISFEYACMGNYQKGIELLEKYLKADPSWGWGWIEYLRELQKYDHDKFLQARKNLDNKLESDSSLRDIADIYEALADMDEDEKQKVKPKF